MAHHQSPSASSSGDSSTEDLLRAAAAAKSKYYQDPVATTKTTTTTTTAARRRSESLASRESSEYHVVHGGGAGASSRQHHHHHHQQPRYHRDPVMEASSSTSPSSASEGLSSDNDSDDAYGGSGGPPELARTSRGGHRSASADSSLIREVQAAGASIGDSRAIVLALRALQDKIRKLESDRDFHREQCDAARKAHETYKAEVEEQLHRDRVEYRQRESELHELIAKAKAEQSRLMRTLDESRADTSSLSGDAAALVERERAEATQRESRLRHELDDYRRQIAEERVELEKVRQAADQARAERDILESTNRRLEHTVKDLLSMNKTLVHHKGTDGGNAPPSARRGDPSPLFHQVRPTSQRSASANSRGGGAAHVQQPPMRFQSATLASIHRRSERTASVTTTAARVPPPGGAGPATNSPAKARPATTARVAATGGGHHYQQHSVSLNMSGASASRRSASAGGGRTVVNTTARQRTRSPQPSPNTSARGAGGPSAVAATAPLDAVYTALEKELRALNADYKNVIDEANRAETGTTPEVLTAKLNSLMVQIDRKSEQLRLLRATKAAAASEDVRGTRSVSAKGLGKATQKTQQMNALRGMATRATRE